jgi:hypothetical protein
MISIMDVLGIVSERLEAAGIEYMLTGSYALAWYTTPRMTRDLDLVVAMEATSFQPHAHRERRKGRSDRPQGL